MPFTFDSVILLTGDAEYTALAAALKAHNPKLAVYHAATLADLEAFEFRVLRHTRLIGFVTPVVVPSHILDRLGFGAYNFHPGPPNYPGWLPAHFAVYEGASDFGVTAHVMTEKVDTGPIVGVELFSIPPITGVETLARLAFNQTAFLFWRLAKTLATQREPLEELPIRWFGRKSTRKMIAGLCDIPFDISAEELRRRIVAFGGGHLGTSPTITLHGVQFRYVPPETTEKNEAPSLVPAQAGECENVQATAP